MQIIHFRAMNTAIDLAGEGNPAQLAQGFLRAQQFIEANEQRFTRFSPASELSQLNRAAGSWFQASAEMLQLVMLAQSYAELTSGLFNPAILPDLLRIGYDRSMDQIRQLDTLPVNNEYPTLNRPPLQGLICDPENERIYLPEGTQLDLSGIAKGWIVEQAAHILAEHASACAINAGGDMFLIGLPAGKTSWEIGLENPLTPDQVLADLNLPPGAIATSTITRRAWKQGPQTRHHIIDPRTGEPADSGWLSVTVIAPHADTCEVFAKALLIGGPSQAATLLQLDPAIACLAVDRDGIIWGPPHSLEYLHAN